MKIKCHVGSLILYGFICFELGIFGFGGLYDPILIHINNDFARDAIRSFSKDHTALQAFEFKKKTEFWMGFAFFTRHVTSATFVAMAALMWTDAYRSFKAGTQKIWIEGMVCSVFYLATVFGLNIGIVLNLATVAGLAEPWYLPSFIFVVVATVVLLVAGFYTTPITTGTDWQKINETDIEGAAEDVDVKDP